MKKACLILSLGVLLSFSLAAAQQAVAPQATAQPPKTEPAKGYLFIIGGGDRSEAMMKRYIGLAERFQSGKIVIYTMASGVPTETGTELVAEFKKLGAKNAVWENLTHDQALVEDNTAVLKDAGGIYFSGGDQARLTAALLDTPIYKKIMELYRQGAVIGGTSAGAAVMSEVMITGDEKRKPGGEEEECNKFRTIETGNIITARGFGFVTRAVIDQHFIVRKRYGRLISVIAEHPDLMGVAINEDTAVLIGPDETFEVVGESYVLVLDPAAARIQALPSKMINIENMTLHLLTPGMRFNLKDRKVVH
jgi:cyanophycinase